ncbi:uncharacterized protein LOC114739818 [Neltuma alba]|uniref:uncharacterized protein LOC114739818 n=1 Tax=Neltuma alba TaxID=207710 RepID=UPI0010A4054E|nr:uncharacterized protein LOC114739818 [Prosopis alba]
MGFMPSTAAKLNALLTGLQICKQYGFKQIHAYTDSLEAFHLITRDRSLHHPLRPTVAELRNLIFSKWDLTINYAPRSTIKCADILARLAHHQTQDLFILQNPPPECDA